MKLQLFISHNSGVSRRKAFEHVLNGDVTVNGVVIREPSHMMEPGEDKVMLLGREIKLTDYEYIMLNKPVGYVTTCEAQFDQMAVVSLLPPALRHLKPVGRLDKDTQGLLFLTNDGELANRLAHPSFDVNKVYHVRVARRMEYREKNRLEEGVVIERFRTAPAKVENVTYGEGFTEFDLTIHEGHKHQVRLMCHEVGHDVLKLTRVAQGPLQLGDLKSGTWRSLTAEELSGLHSIGLTRIAPVFKSHPPRRTIPSGRDWSRRPSTDKHSSEPGLPQSPARRSFKRPSRPEGDRPRGDRPYSRGPREDRPAGERREYRSFDRSARPGSDRPRSDRPYSRGPREDRPAGERREYKPYDRSARSGSDRPRGERPYQGASREGSPSKGPRAFGAKPSFGKKPFGKKPFGNKPFNRKPSFRSS